MLISNDTRNFMWDTFVDHCYNLNIDLDDLDYDTWLEDFLNKANEV